MRQKRNPPLEGLQRSSGSVVQTGQQSGNGDGTNGDQEEVIVIDPTQVLNNVASTAVGVVAGTIITRALVGEDGP